jgi:tetratricopeptide (TPR) repeat protein
MAVVCVPEDRLPGGNLVEWAVMLKRIRIVVVGVALVLPACGGGKEEAVVQLRYQVSAKRGFPPGLKSLAVLPMDCDAEDESRWQEMATAMMHRQIAMGSEANGLGLTLADRMNAARVLEERSGIQAGIIEGSDAQAAAKLMGVDALVMGRVIIKVEVLKGKKSTITGIPGLTNPGSVRPGRSGIETEERDTVKRNATIQVTFRLLDATTGKDWFTWAPDRPVMVTHEAAPGLLFGQSKGEGDLDPLDGLVAAAVEEAITGFVSQFMPTEREFSIAVESSGNEQCALGVQRIRAEDYEGAEAALKLALEEDPEDERGLFALGVVYEVQGRYEEALRAYRDAYALDDDRKFRAARDRVKGFLEGGTITEAVSVPGDEEEEEEDDRDEDDEDDEEDDDE